MSHARCIRVEATGRFKVFCVRCNCDLGIWTGDVLSAAITSEASKQGVMCPSCRAKACRGCGGVLRGLDKAVGLCYFCEQEAEIRESKDLVVSGK